MTLAQQAPGQQTAAAGVVSPSRRDVISLDPMTRVGGGLGVQVETDGYRITDARAYGTLYRGYEHIVNGRDVRDALPLTSRMCGWCGAVHMTTSSMALEMAWGLKTPPMAVALRSIAEATEAIWIHAAHLAVRLGPDYSARVVEATTPGLFKRAQRTRAPRENMHGFASIGDIMEALTPWTGDYWVDTIPHGRRVQQMIGVLYGKFPHPSVLTPGGVGSTLGWAHFTDYYTRLYLAVDYVKAVCALWDDLIEFLYEADERFLHLGERPASFVHTGCWDEVYSDMSYESLDQTGVARLSYPGVMVDGQLITNKLSDVHLGIEEYVKHSFYEQGASAGGSGTAANLPPQHPWLKTNTPRPQTRSAERYSWCTAPRWSGEVVESTPLGRLWLTALRKDFPPNDFIEPTGTGIRILVPQNFYPETVVEWRIPERANALERVRADAYGIAFAGLSAALALLKAFELTRMGEMRTTVPLRVPDDERMGVGLWESGRGTNVHWVHTRKGKIVNYQVISPSTFNASPRDDAGRPGPLEEALVGSPIIEEPRNGKFSGIDAMRIIHSFDPCMNCGVH